MPTEQEIWQRLGRERSPGRRRQQALTVAFVGSAYPHKGPQLLVQAGQLTADRLNVRIIGEVRDEFAAALRAIDERGVLELGGGFAPSELGAALEGMMPGEHHPRLERDAPYASLEIGASRWTAERACRDEASELKGGRQLLTTVVEHIASGRLAAFNQLLLPTDTVPDSSSRATPRKTPT